MTKVTLTLRPHVAEKLKKMCYARQLTASHLIDSWVLTADDEGKHPERENKALNSLFGRWP